MKRHDKWTELMKLLGGARHLEEEGYFDLAEGLRSDARILFDELIAGILRQDGAWDGMPRMEEAVEAVTASPAVWLRPEGESPVGVMTASGPVSFHLSAETLRDQACG